MYNSLEKICQIAKEKKIPFYQVIISDNAKEDALSEEQEMEKMLVVFRAMKDADSKYDPSLKSASNMAGTQAAKLMDAKESGRLLCGDFVASVAIHALKTAESNACMKRIVAAPTAGSCGVVPAVLLSIQERCGFSDEKMAESLFVAAGIGGVIAARASLSGAEGGCQAEIGSASAMAAGAAAYLAGESEEGIIQACAIALKGLLGLACDPVAGLVEVPCVKRNVLGAVNALTAADMAIAGIYSQIPPDQVIDAMGAIGHVMSPTLKETGEGGLAVTLEGLKRRNQMKM